MADLLADLLGDIADVLPGAGSGFRTPNTMVAGGLEWADDVVTSMATHAGPLVRRADDVEYETVDAADGLRKGVLIGEPHGASTLAIRRFVLEPGGTVPKHTNEIEHEQYVLEGEYVVGIDDEEVTVSAGDSLHIPSGTVHWYRNEHDDPGAFICAVPTVDDEIQLLEE